MPLLDDVERRLAGARIEDILRRDHSWNFELSIGTLEVVHLWRLLQDGALVVSDREDGLTYGEPTPIDAEEQARRRLVGRRILVAMIEPETADLRISLEGSLRLDVLTVQARTEAWNLSSSEFHVSATGGQLSDPAWFLGDSARA